MYESYFGLSEKPFSLRPDSDFYYFGRDQRSAAAILEYGYAGQTASVSLLTGDPGVGKTLLLRHLMRSNSGTVRFAYVFHSGVDSWPELLRWVLLAFDGQVDDSSDPVRLIGALVEQLSNEAQQGRSSVLVMDEAQLLSDRLLEYLRVLANINADREDLLHIILCGQSSLRERLGQGFTAIRQRLVADVHLTPLRAGEIGDYVSTRLRQAGCDQPLFERMALELIWRASMGNPRLINVLCDTALLYACAEQKRQVTSALVSDVIREKRASLLPINVGNSSASS